MGRHKKDDSNEHVISPIIAFEQQQRELESIDYKDDLRLNQMKGLEQEQVNYNQLL